LCLRRRRSSCRRRNSQRSACRRGVRDSRPLHARRSR
jgi:hypothetical protein